MRLFGKFNTFSDDVARDERFAITHSGLWQLVFTS